MVRNGEWIDVREFLLRRRGSRRREHQKEMEHSTKKRKDALESRE